MADELEGFAVVEVMGHSKFAGRVSEHQIAGAAFVRVDVAESNGTPAFTKLIATGSIFAITPCTEEVARAVQTRAGSSPLSVYGLEARALAPPRDDDDEFDEFDEP